MQDGFPWTLNTEQEKEIAEKIINLIIEECKKIGKIAAKHNTYGILRKVESIIAPDSKIPVEEIISLNKKYPYPWETTTTHDNDNSRNP